MMTKEGSTQIVTLMTPGTGVLILGRDHISHYSEYVLSSPLSIYFTLLSYTIVDFYLFYDGGLLMCRCARWVINGLKNEDRKPLACRKKWSFAFSYKSKGFSPTPDWYFDHITPSQLLVQIISSCLYALRFFQFLLLIEIAFN